MGFVSALLLVAGYGVALPVLIRIRAVFAERRTRSFAAFEAATVAVALGHQLAGRPIAAGINAVAAVIVAGAWWEMGRRARLRPGPSLER